VNFACGVVKIQLSSVAAAAGIGLSNHYPPQIPGEGEDF